LDPVSAANTAAATSGAGKWMDVGPLEGYLIVTQQVGALVGTSINGKLQVATDANGTGAADVPGATFVSVVASNNVQKLVINKASLANRFLGYVGTCVVTSVLVGVSALGASQSQ
jgi:hypothetical protein